MPSIDRASSEPLYQQIYLQIAKGIDSGLYSAGKKLPSIRACARDLGVSNTTIELAYQKLTEEGYVQARRGSGYVICSVNTAPDSPLDRFSEDFKKAQRELADQTAQKRKDAVCDYDFSYDAIDPSLFPFNTWARISREVFFEDDAEKACLYNEGQGLYELRVQIARYLQSEYGLPSVPEQILIMPTTRSLVAEIIPLLEDEASIVAIEEPGYDEVRRMVERYGFHVRQLSCHPVPQPDNLTEQLEGTQVAFLTPSCQFPTNEVMPLPLREAIVTWAQENNAYLIDDEYGWEFLSPVTRSPSLAALDASGRVITMGSFSCSFTPAVCLSYAILPPQLMLKWAAQNQRMHPCVPWQTQAAMAVFMRDDHWRRHIRKTRTMMQKKRELLATALDKYLGDAFEIVGSNGGLFMLVRAKDGRSEADLIAAAAKANVKVYPTSQYWNGNAPENWNCVLVGYASIPVIKIEPGIKALAKAWKQ